MMKKLLLSFALILSISVLSAQSWDEQLWDLRKEMDTQKARPSFKQKWKLVDLEQEILRKEEPFPLSPKAVDSKVQISRPFKGQVVSHPNTQYTSRPKHYPQTATLRLAETNALNKQGSFRFFGKQLSMRYHSNMYIQVGDQIDQKAVVRAWRQLSHSSADAVVFQIMEKARQMRLNDWAFVQLSYSASRSLYPRDENARVLFTLYSLVEAGYKARVCANGKKLHLLLPTHQTLYGATFFREGQQKYYVLDPTGKKPKLNKAFILDLNYPRSARMLDMNIKQEMALPAHVLERDLSFTFNDKRYNVSVKMNKNLVHFYKYYPFTDWHIQMQTQPSQYVYRSLVPTFKRYTREMSKPEAVNFLLRFVQTAFPYKTDTEQFGEENYLFIEEMLYYKYSDCEDRSALFAWLVKETLGLEVIGLIFPGHAATAVKFPRPVNGAYLSYKGSKYTICDPTYMYANYGMVQPDLKSKRAKIFPL